METDAPRFAVGPNGLVPQDASGALPRSAKRRGSLADLAKANRECTPCREQARQEEETRSAAAAVSPGPTLPPGAEGLMPAPARYEDLAWLRRWAAAGTDPAADVRRYAVTPDPAPPRGPPLVGWLHVATIGRWRPILMELLSAVDRSGLRAATSRVLLGVVGPDADLAWLPPWVTVVGRDGDLDMGENSTLRALWDWSRAAPPSKIWYAHTKGASRGDNPNVTAWRDYLVYWNVLRWGAASASLDGPYDAYGVDYATPADTWFPEVWGPGLPNGSGFVGNFWWANSAYLAAMPGERVILSRSRWDAEWSFVGAGGPRVRQPYETRKSLYHELFPRSRYDPEASCS